MRRPTAAVLMDPLRVVLGARVPLADAMRRFVTHEAALAPVLSAGRTAGILSRATAEHATRMGAGELPVSEVLCGGAPHVGRMTGPALMKRRTLGVAPGLIVRGPGRVVAGLISRQRVDEVCGAAGRTGRDLRGRLARLMGAQRAALLRRAGALAAARGVGLHLAGGVVRDLLMERAPGDLDLVVEGDGIAFASNLCEELGGTLTRHERFGTAVIRLDEGAGGQTTGLRIDVTTARHETYAHPAALPSVEPGSIFDDIHRRDVTINSMTIRLDGRSFGILVDEIGGQRDLLGRALQVHHRLSLVDDPTRAFRIARFAARFGFTPSRDARRSLSLARELGAFERLGGERLYRELGLIATEPEPWRVWKHCADTGLMGDIGPALRWQPETMRRMERLIRFVRRGGLASAPHRVDSALLMLMLLSCGGSRASRQALASRLRLTGRPAARLEWCAGESRALAGILSREPGAARIVRACENAEPEVIALVWALGGPAAKAIERYLRRLRHIRPATTGEALQRMGVPAGPLYADVLARLRDAILEGRIKNEAEERLMALRLVRRMSPGR